MMNKSKTKAPQLKETCSGHSGRINCVCFSNDDQTVLSGSEDGTMQIWQIKSDSGAIFRYVGHKGPITSLDINKNNSLIATGSTDTSIRLWKPQKFWFFAFF